MLLLLFLLAVIGLLFKFQSPEWSEFATGETTLALHPASERNPAGKIELGFHVPDLEHWHAEMTTKGVQFPVPTTKQEYGGMLAQFVDSEGSHVSVSTR